MGLFDSLSSGAGDVLSNFGGNLLNDYFIGDRNAQDAFNNSTWASERAYQNSMAAYDTRFQNTAADMKAAGLNPILAASGGFQVGQGPQGFNAQSFQAPVTQSPVQMSSSAKNYSEANEADVRADVEANSMNVQDATVAKLNQDIQNGVADVYKSRAEAGLATAKEQEAVQAVQESLQRVSNLVLEAKKISADTGKIEQESKTSASQAILNMESAATMGKSRELMDVQKQREAAVAGKANQEVENLKQQFVELRAQSNVYDTWYGRMLKYVGATTGAIGNLIKGSAVMPINP